MEESGLSLRTVNRGLKDLKAEGWIAVWEPGGRWLDGMWQGVCLIAAMRSIENRLFSDSAGYKGLRSLINQASRMCERIER